MTGSGDPVRLIGNSVSADFFSVLGEQAAMGRTFQSGEDQPGKDNEVILSSAPGSGGFSHIRTLSAGGSRWKEWTANRGRDAGNFRFLWPKTELWVPLHLDPRYTGHYWGDSYMPVVGRLRPGATLLQARAELQTMRPSVLADFPGACRTICL